MADDNGSSEAVGVQAPRAADDPLYCALPPTAVLVGGTIVTTPISHEWRAFPLVVPGVATAQVLLVTYCIHCRLTMTGPLAVGRSPLAR